MADDSDELVYLSDGFGCLLVLVLKNGVSSYLAWLDMLNQKRHGAPRIDGLRVSWSFTSEFARTVQNVYRDSSIQRLQRRPWTVSAGHYQTGLTNYGVPM